jgi:hypothetical protein
MSGSGGTWTVNVSAGNASYKNEEIDVFIPIGITAQCNPGDFVECYTGVPATLGVGECKSGHRTCLSDGTWGNCQGEILPQPEICDNGKDNDCDGEVDESCFAGTIRANIFCTVGVTCGQMGKLVITFKECGSGGSTIAEKSSTVTLDQDQPQSVEIEITTSSDTVCVEAFLDTNLDGLKNAGDFVASSGEVSVAVPGEEDVILDTVQQ